MPIKKIGFSHGALHKVADKYLESTINVYKKCSNDVIEVFVKDFNEADKLLKIAPYIKNFLYRSIHLPTDINYKKDEQIVKLLDSAVAFYKEINADYILIHPDRVDNWEIFDKYKVSWAVENMDKGKKGYKTVEEFISFFDKKPSWKLVLDLNHCYTNDKTMKLADDMIENFKDRIVRIHLSGCKEDHDPIFQTKQNFILDYCNKVDVPIVIESIFDNVDDVKKEYNYIKKYLK